MNATWTHIYVSTYCQHRRHDQCRLACKTCASPCQCPCHDKTEAKLAKIRAELEGRDVLGYMTAGVILDILDEENP